MLLNNKQIKYLKSLAVNIQPKYQIGKNEVTDNTLDLFDKALTKNELIKVSVNTSVKEEKVEFANKIAEALNCEIVQIVGNNITLFRKNLKDGTIHLPN
jgi:RNA-binding protein